MKCAFWILCASLASAQTIAFETASIKPVADISKCDNSMIQPLPGGGLRVQCMPLRAIITWTYQIQDYQLSGGPSWLSSSWNIMANSESGSAEALRFEESSEAQRVKMLEDIRLRLRALLADRFQLKLRTESKEQTVYALKIGKSGPRLKEVEHPGMIRRGKAQILSTGTTLAMLCSYLGIALGRPVAEKTGLTAYYAFDLNWTPEGSDAEGPSLVTAIQEQLGLRLEAIKGQVDTLIIERIEEPSAN